MKLKIDFVKLHKDAVIPSKAHVTDAGYDLTATSKDIDVDGNIVYGFGIAVSIPAGYCGKLYPRSSNAKRKLLLSNSVGVIDSGFLGEITAKFKPCETYNTSYKGRHDPQWEIGDRVCQLCIEEVIDVDWQEVDDLGETERGTGGYGSSGK